MSRFTLAFNIVMVATLGAPVLAQAPDTFVSNRDEFYSTPTLMTGFTHVIWGTGAIPKDRNPGIWASIHGQPDPGGACSLTKAKRRAICDNAANADCMSQPTAQAGPKTDQTALDPTTVRSLTGLATADQVFMPMCPGSGQRGEAFVALSQAEDGGGIGLSLRTGQGIGTGTGAAGQRAFLQVAPDNAFADLQGTYFNFRAAHLKPGLRMRPFHGAKSCRGKESCEDSYQLEASTDQTFAQFDNNGHAGVVQMFRFLLRNSNGTPGLRDDGVINIGMRTYCNHSSVSRRDTDCPNRVSIDPKQGSSGQRYFSGNFGKAGEETQVSIKHGSAGAPYTARLWTSHGDPTGDAPFTDRKFRATISWPQFVSMLRGMAYSAGQDGSTDAGVAAFFGDGWSDPDNWFVQSVRFGQELKNTNWNGAVSARGTGAGSGGSMERFSIRALKP